MSNLNAHMRLTVYPPEQVSVRVRDGKKLAHDGIKVEFVGSIGEVACLVPPVRLLHVFTLRHRCRALLRPGTPPRVPVTITRIGCAWRDAAGADLRLFV